MYGVAWGVGSCPLGCWLSSCASFLCFLFFCFFFFFCLLVSSCQHVLVYTFLVRACLFFSFLVLSPTSPFQFFCREFAFWVLCLHLCLPLFCSGCFLVFVYTFTPKQASTRWRAFLLQEHKSQGVSKHKLPIAPLWGLYVNNNNNTNHDDNNNNKNNNK